ncbi:MAG: hypothetical protein HY298_09640 [Verrucomicrobia bacterium]|nr:hypothetical protein [Verrucomicrobiota bacterium]
MNRLAAIFRRECRVTFSRRAQPVWFRAIKWAGILTGAALFRDRAWFWWCLAVLLIVAMSVHLLYRLKTKTWTRAWGGWNDLAAGRD